VVEVDPVNVIVDAFCLQVIDAVPATIVIVTDQTSALARVIEVSAEVTLVKVAPVVFHHPHEQVKASINTPIPAPAFTPERTTVPR
jgi:hypothetical protein